MTAFASVKNLRSKLNWTQVMVLIIVWLLYVSSYLLRKPFSIVKLGIKESMDLSEHMLAYIDLAFFLSYALGSLLFGYVGDRIGARITLGTGLLGSAIITAFMGLLDNYAVFLSLLFLSGLFQSVLFPACMALISNWFPKKHLTYVIGIFRTSVVFGSVLSTFITVKVVEISSWHNAFYIPAAISFIVASIEFIFVKNNNVKKHSDEEVQKAKVQEISSLKFWEVLMLPNVPLTCFAFIFLVGIRCTFTFWLPYYLSTVFNYNESQSGYISLIYDIGYFIGPLVLTIITNLLFSNDLLAFLFLSVFNIVFTLLLLWVNEAIAHYLLVISLFFVGAFTSTMDVVSNSYVTQVGSNHGACISILSVFHGICSIGKILIGPLIAHLSFWFGMISMVPCMVVFNACCASAILWLLMQERMEIKHKKSLPNVKIISYNKNFETSK